MSLFGLPVPSSKYDQFWALDDISFTIRRGERVALVGRNGAGKSTLLRHISGELTASAGTIRVNGNVKALFGLGEGFHPEFSGYDNIKTALTLHGVRWKDIPRTVSEIIEFTELEDFIDRPLKEYSAGMYARLAFATATAAKPDILIIDEILGAGDAYFLGKCLQRIRDITSNGATVLFVSHDMGSALMLCERGIWIDRGKLRTDADMPTVAREYQAHIREEQELALRARSMRLSKKVVAQYSSGILLRFISPGETAPREPFYVSRIAWGKDDISLGEMELGKLDTDGNMSLIVDPQKNNWGKSARVHGRPCRPFADFGGAYVHAPFMLNQAPENHEALWLEMDVLPSLTHQVELQLFSEADGEYRTIVVVPPVEEPQWQTIRTRLHVGTTDLLVAKQARKFVNLDELRDSDVVESVSDNLLADSHNAIESGEGNNTAPRKRGDGQLTQSDVSNAVFLGRARPKASIRKFEFVDAEERPRHTLISGDPVRGVLEFEAIDLPDCPIAVVAIYSPDGNVISQMISPLKSSDEGILEGQYRFVLCLDELLIGPGDYIASVALFHELNASKPPEDCAYDLRDREYALKILDKEYTAFPLGLVRQKPYWTLEKI